MARAARHADAGEEVLDEVGVDLDREAARRRLPAMQHVLDELAGPRGGVCAAGDPGRDLQEDLCARLELVLRGVVVTAWICSSGWSGGAVGVPRLGVGTKVRVAVSRACSSSGCLISARVVPCSTRSPTIEGKLEGSASQLASAFRLRMCSSRFGRSTVTVAMECAFRQQLQAGSLPRRGMRRERLPG